MWTLHIMRFCKIPFFERKSSRKGTSPSPEALAEILHKTIYMNDFSPLKLKEITEKILSTNDTIKLKSYFEEYLTEYNKINFRPDLIDGKNQALKILNDSFEQHYFNCAQENENRYDLKDLVFSLANMSNFINLNIV